MAQIWVPNSMLNPIKLFLQKNKFIPITLWNVFEISHTINKPTKEEKRQIKKYIFSKVGDVPGLYAYMDNKGTLLYVGKSKRIINRIFSHYCESFCIPKENDKSVAWPIFFSKYEGELKVYWIELHGDREQCIVEEMIERCIKTQFDIEYPRGKRNIKKSKI